MALTPQEQEELTRLEAELGNSVMVRGDRPKTFTEELKQATIENLPAMGGMIGGVAGGLLTRSAPGVEYGAGLGSAAIRSMIGAGLGGATGEAAKMGIEGITPSVRSTLGIIRGGVEQAAYDGIGNLVFSAGGRAFQITKDALSKRFAGTPPEDAVVAAQKLLQSGDGTLTPFQATKDSWSGFKESLARGSFTGKPVFEKAAEKNVEAITTAKTKVLDEVSTRVYDSLQTGTEFATAIQQGDDALKSAVKPFYEAISTQARRIPVDIVPIQAEASRVLNAADRAKGLTLSETEKGYLQRVIELPESIDFATTHEIASSLKTKLRDLKRGNEPDTATVARLTRLVSQLEKQMDEAGKKLTGKGLDFEGRLPEDKTANLADQYKFYSKLYRDSIQDLYSDTASKLLSKDAEFVGKNIFQSGNVTAWNEAKQALARAKQLNPKLNVQQTLESVQRGYLENLLKSEGSFASLGDKIKNDEAVRRTFEAVLPKATQGRVKTLLEAARLSEVQPSATAPLFLAAQQAQTIGALGSVGALVLSDEARGVAADNPIKTALLGGTILLGPRFWAKAATSPEATNAALGIIKSQQAGTPIGKNLFLKATGAFERAGITGEDLTARSEQKAQPVGLTDAEKEELQRLEAEVGQ
ncbi:hypothetical protein UFOVP837_16 [uncultured Caudovirales phage]|jgi:hypothetical protein|uniref:Uncharacterized protein n=1 Tax=uncultured Caudovirales phage TaxID=2100421 RepID=A0A6J5PAN0_9CAUD|nr:hypothetical protein UFOVP837_16 [uncultured Caudovirales phage]